MKQQIPRLALETQTGNIAFVSRNQYRTNFWQVLFHSIEAGIWPSDGHIFPNSFTIHEDTKNSLKAL